MQNNIKNLNSILISNLNEANLNKLTKIINDLDKYRELENTNSDIYQGLNSEIRQKFIELSYQIYLEAYNPNKIQKELVDFQNKILEIYSKNFDNPLKIKEYLNNTEVILFLRISKKPFINKNQLYWNNSFNTYNNNKFKEKYKNYIEKFLQILDFELNNLDKIKKNNLELLKKKSNMINVLSKIYYQNKLNNTRPNFNERIIKYYKKFLENIYKFAKDKKDKDFLSYLEIYNNLFAEFAKYFGYPNDENNDNYILFKNLEELFKILKTLNLENKNQSLNLVTKNHKRQNITNGVQLTMNSLLGKVKNRVNEKLKGKKEINNYSSINKNINKNINRQDSLSELKKIAENILKLYDSTFNKKDRIKLHSLFKKIIKKIQTDILPRFNRNKSNIEKMEEEINTKQKEQFVF